ncbi:MAG TPA: SDR family oxidoreductase [Gemmatales bacterium]|nr:SDR family oxidoreductase [Gemmatales bacterium]HMP60247.1 SDR family oxidoreductase [Gemmatales bacterium]
MELAGKVAIVTGASRGIGRAIAMKLSAEGADLVLAAKTMEPDSRLPGTLPEVAAAVEKLGRKALAVRTNVRETADLERLVAETLRVFGRVDYLINNAGALWWYPVAQTPPKKFDLVMEVNVRAAFILSHLVVPAMIAQKSGHIVNMSPPIDFDVLPGRVGYLISKFGMTMLAMGLAAELAPHGATANALWPRTIIESQATINFGLGDRSQWRDASIMADATFELVRHQPAKHRGQALLDEDVLRGAGVTDFGQYACVPGSEPAELTWKLDAGQSPHKA